MRYLIILALSLLLPGQALAELLFSEYIEGSGNNKALEIYNPSIEPVDLGPYQVHFFFNGSTAPGTTIDLTGTVAAGSVFVLAHESADAAIRDRATQTAGGSWFNGDDAIVLFRDSQPVDAIGQMGFDPGSQWGSGSIGTRDATLRRKAEINTGDTDPSDLFDPAVHWEGFDQDTFADLGTHSARTSLQVVSTTPSADSADVAPGADIRIAFNQDVTPTCGWFAIHCTGSGAHTATVSGGPQEYRLDPVPEFAAAEACTVTVFAGQVTSQADGATLAENVVFGFATAPGDGAAGDGDALDEYYAPAQGLAGQALKAALHQIIRGHRARSYDEAWLILEEADADPNNPDHVIGFYSRRSIPKTDRDQGGNTPDFWNREHVWPKSHGFPNRGQHAHTDTHHLRATDKSVNGDRGNRDFDDGGTQHDECMACRFDADSWEPPDLVKGDTARMVFYMAVRYEGDDGNTPDLELVDVDTDEGEPRLGHLCSLQAWHLADPVSDTERQRNDVIQRWQGNRNPFIDHPEWATSIWGADCGL